MSQVLFQCVEISSAQFLEKPTEHFEVARIIAEQHYQKTGEHCMVVTIEMCWVTSFLGDALNQNHEKKDY